MDKIKSEEKKSDKANDNFIRLQIPDETMDYLMVQRAPVYKKAIVSREVAELLTVTPEYYNRMYLVNCPLKAKRIERVVFLTKSKKTFEADVINISFSRANGQRKAYWVAELQLRNLTKK